MIANVFLESYLYVYIYIYVVGSQPICIYTDIGGHSKHLLRVCVDIGPDSKHRPRNQIGSHPRICDDSHIVLYYIMIYVKKCTM